MSAAQRSATLAASPSLDMWKGSYVCEVSRRNNVMEYTAFQLANRHARETREKRGVYFAKLWVDGPRQERRGRQVRAEANRGKTSGRAVVVWKGQRIEAKKKKKIATKNERTGCGNWRVDSG